MPRDAQDRVVAVSYPADEDYARINSEVLDGQAKLVYTYELDDAGRREALAGADAVLSWTLAREIPAGALDEAQLLAPDGGPPAHRAPTCCSTIAIRSTQAAPRSSCCIRLVKHPII